MSPLQAQFKTWHVFEQWNKNEGLTSYVYKSSSAFDTDGNLYIVGGTLNLNNNYDWLITKYNALGEVIWIEQYDGSAGSDDYATDIYIDSNNTLYITGVVTVDTSQGWDLAMSIYDSTGTQQALDTYDGGQGYPYYDDGGVSIYVDEMNGYVYVGGGSGQIGTGTDFVLIQYDLSGNRQWVEYYDNAGGTDIVSDVYVDDMGFVFITGGTQTTSNGWKVKILEYDMSGSLQNISGTGSFQEDMDEIHFVNRDQYQNIYVTGYVNSLTEGKNLKTIAFDSTLALLWSDTLNSPDDMDDMGWGVYCDSMNHVYVGGYVTRAATGQDMVLIKYDTSGTRIWTKYYNGSDSLDDGIVGVTVDARGNVIVTGYSTIVGNKDFYTIKYDTSGAKVWEINYNSRANKDDHADGISIDAYGDIYVFGQSGDPGGGLPYTYVTVKYRERELYNLADNDTIPSGFNVTANLGQLLNSDSSVCTSVKYYSSTPSVYFQSNRISYVYFIGDTILATPDSLYRMDMVFTDDTTKQVLGLDKQDFFSNYYYPHTASTKGLCRVPSYSQVYYPNIYNGVDAYITTKNLTGLKKQFVVRPGESAKPSDIKFSFDGEDTVYIDGSGNLIVVSLPDTMKYDAPLCWQVDSGGSVVSPVSSPVYTLSGDIVSFTDGSWASSYYPIIIEMNQGVLAPLTGTADWSTFFGGNKDDMALDMTHDNEGNIFVIGKTASTDFPITINSGIYSVQTTYGSGLSDAFVIRFNPNYFHIWSTFYGGAKEDEGFGITYDSFLDKLYICGTTVNAYPTAMTQQFGTGYCQTNGSGTLGFIARLNTEHGQRDWGTYIGSIDTRPKRVKTDANGNVFVIGNIPAFVSISDTCAPPIYNDNFPACNPGGGAYFQNWNSSYFDTTSIFLYDGFISKFSPATNLVWSTLLGGERDEWMGDLVIDNANQKLYVVGQTRSSNNGVTCAATGGFPLCNAGGYFQSYPNSGVYPCGFISRFSLNGVMDWSTFFGSSGEDMVTDIDLGTSGQVFICGYTNAHWAGTPDCGVPTNFGFPSCSTAYYEPPTGFYDFDAFIARFDASTNLGWSTFFGGNSSEALEPYDGTIRITVNPNNKVFLYGNTRSGSTTGGSPVPLYTHTASGYYNQSVHADNGGTITNTDAFVTGFDYSGSLIWSTYFGGKGHLSGTFPYMGDFAGDITTYGYKIYICGGSFSISDFPLYCPTGASCWNYNHVSSSYRDAFIAQLTTDPEVGIEEENGTLNSSLLAYPNPTSGIINLKFIHTKNEKIGVYLLDMTGRIIAIDQVNVIAGINNLPMNIHFLSSGIYFIRLQSIDASYTVKIIKE